MRTIEISLDRWRWGAGSCAARIGSALGGACAMTLLLGTASQMPAQPPTQRSTDHRGHAFERLLEVFRCGGSDGVWPPGCASEQSRSLKMKITERCRASARELCAIASNKRRYMFRRTRLRVAFAGAAGPACCCARCSLCPCPAPAPRRCPHHQQSGASCAWPQGVLDTMTWPPGSQVAHLRERLTRLPASQTALFRERPCRRARLDGGKR